MPLVLGILTLLGLIWGLHRIWRGKRTTRLDALERRVDELERRH